MDTCLVSRPIPILGESPASILMRAVEGNGYPNLQSLIWSYWQNGSGKEWAKAAHTDPERYEEILNTFGIEVPEVESICFRRGGPTSESPRVIEGMKVPEAMFREDGRYYCPRCLAKHPFWRRNWAIRAYSVCTEHHVYLLRDCQVCNSELKPWRGKLAKCDCGASLQEMMSAPADPSAVAWWFELHRISAEEVACADALFLALSEAEGGGGDPQAEHRRLCTVRAWIEKGEIAQAILEWMGRDAYVLHPRLLLLPLLRRAEHTKISGLARAILKQWEFRGSVPELSGNEAITRHEAELALGISSAQFRKFVENSLLDFPNGGKPQRGRVSLAAINRLLFSLHATKGEITDTDTVGRNQTCSIASMAASVLSCESESAGYDVAEGLNTLRLTQQVCGKQLESNEMVEWLDTKQVAEKLGTYPEAVRFLRIKGWIEFRDKDLQGRKRYVASRENVDQFNQSYVLGGTIASQIGINPTNLSEKLMALGVQPVAGPTIDGFLVYLFRRSEVEPIDPDVLRRMERYPTNTGRKRKLVKSADDEGLVIEMTTDAAAEVLEIRPYDVYMLIREGILQRVSKLSREIFVSGKSVRSLQRRLDRKDLITIDEAAKRLGISSGALESRWIKTGVLCAVNLGLWRRITTKKLEELEALLAEYVTAADAGHMLGMHRSHLPNLERGGAIRSKKIGSGQGVRLYARSDLKKLKSET